VSRSSLCVTVIFWNSQSVRFIEEKAAGELRGILVENRKYCVDLPVNQHSDHLVTNAIEHFDSHVGVSTAERTQ
jgi:hypothetical protein